MIENNAIGIVHTLTGTHTYVKESFPAKAGTASRHVQDLKLRYPMYMYMGRPTYVCASCSEHFSRKYSATRHNITIHNGRGEIVPLLDFLVGRSSGRYLASHPSWYRRSEKRIHRFGHATVTESMGDSFRPGGLQQQTPFQSTPTLSSPPSEPLYPGASPYPTDLISQPTGTLSQETMLKIQELKKLVYRHPIYSNPDGVVKCVTYFSINGDNTLLDEKLEQLRALMLLVNTSSFNFSIHSGCHLSSPGAIFTFVCAP